MSNKKPSSYIVLDTETTSADPVDAKIIEFAAVRVSFKTGRIEKKMSTLINPGISIPKIISSITGIGNKDVITAPTWDESVEEIIRFIGSKPVVGHNVGFDLGMLKSHKVDLSENLTFDTWLLSAIAFPVLPAFNLEFLSRYFKLDTKSTHRALDDVFATNELFRLILNKIESLLPATKENMLHVLENSSWKAKQGVIEALSVKIKHQPKDSSKLNSDDQKKRARIKATVSGGANKFFGNQGTLKQAMGEDFDYRESQEKMAEVILKVFNSRDNAIIEAGTGVGKSLAYLWATLASQKHRPSRVVVATKTINLQQQLFDKEIPLLAKLWPKKFKASLLFGRSNYLCKHKLAELDSRKRFSKEETPLWLKVLVWLESTTTGFLDEINLNREEIDLKNRLLASDEFCWAKEHKECWFYEARREAQKSDIIVANHAMILENAKLAEPFLKFDNLIVDEAHTFEDSASDAASVRLALQDFEVVIFKLIGRKSQNSLITTWPGFKELRKVGKEAWKQAKEVFVGARGFLSEEPFSSRDLVELRSSVEWSDLDGKVKELILTCHSLEGLVKDCLGDISSKKTKEVVANALLTVEEIRMHLEEIIINPKPNFVYWLDKNNRGLVVMNKCPIIVAEFVNTSLFNKLSSVILTSATMSTSGNFSYLKNRLGISDDFQEYYLDSPFDYVANSLVVVPSDIALPGNKDRYYQDTARVVIDTAVALEGKTMALFTSYEMLEKVYDLCFDALFEHNITLLGQGMSGGRQKVLSKFKDSPTRSVLLGTRSFWQGVDIKGDDLSGLIITKLPFDVPTDPLFSARSQYYSNSFIDYSVPRAILKLKQGFGRLIRCASDRGVCILLDKRLNTMQYGRMFLASLPPARQESLKLDEIEARVKQFIENRVLPVDK